MTNWRGGPGWTEDEDVALVRLHAIEGLSFAQVCMKIGRSRSSCVGRFSRLQQSGRFKRIMDRLVPPPPAVDAPSPPAPKHVLAARDVPKGECWAFRDHPNQAMVNDRACRAAGCRNTRQPGYAHGLCATCNASRLAQGGRRA